MSLRMSLIKSKRLLAEQFNNCILGLIAVLAARCFLAKAADQSVARRWEGTSHV